MKKLTKKDKNNIIQAWIRKQEEYDKLSLEELKELYPTLKATYAEACIAVVERKLKLQKEENLKEAIKDVKSNIEDAEIVEEVKIDKPETNE